MRHAIIAILLAWAAWLAVPGAAFAHSASTAYLDIGADGEHALEMRLRIALRDLDAVLDLDSNADGSLRWGEVLAHRLDIGVYLQSALQLGDRNGPCALRLGAIRFERIEESGFASIDARSRCDPASARLDYRILDRIDPMHRALLSRPGQAVPGVLAPGTRVALALGESKAQTGWFDYVPEGFTHILSGIDHLLFLAVLLLPAVMRRVGARWVAREDIGGALRDLAWITTAFTLAHSLTLALASFGIVQVPARIIEPLIAATVLATALNNLWPLVTTHMARIAFAFGLIHGFGFAEVLAPLGLSSAAMARALFGFNLGVEAGQLCVVISLFAVLAGVRAHNAYPRWILGAGSATLAAVACAWLVERVFDVSLFGTAMLAAAGNP